MSAIPAGDDRNLPALREDLSIERGAPRIDGGPAWILRDPARHLYYQINARTVELLSLWSEGTQHNLARRLLSSHGSVLREGELPALVEFLQSNQLTVTPKGGHSRVFAHMSRSARKLNLPKVLRKMLFLRVPIFRPDSFLRATLPIAEVFFLRAFTWITLVLGAIGFLIASRQLDAFFAYVENALTPRGAISYVFALVFVKALHELGHAYQATRRGVRVPTMGVAFMVFIPLLYTDVSDAWRLRKRRDKLMIDAAGVIVELHLALLGTFAWAFLPDGGARNVAFVLATSSWLVSLFVKS